MTSSDDMETAQLACSAELARPLVHECNNFLNNLFLQLAVMELNMPAQHRSDWDSIRRDGKKLAGLLQQWQSQRIPNATGPDRAELNSSIGEIIAELEAEHPRIDLRAIPTPEPLWLANSSGSVKRLFWLLLQDAIEGLETDEKNRRGLTVRIARKLGTITIEIAESGPTPFLLDWSQFTECAGAITCLTAAACHLLVERCQGRIGVEHGKDGVSVLVVEFSTSGE